MGRFSDEEGAIELANNTNYGLGAGLHSSSTGNYPVPTGADRDISKAMRTNVCGYPRLWKQALYVQPFNRVPMQY